VVREWYGAGHGEVDGDILPTDHLAPHDVELRADWANPVRLANLSPRDAAMVRSEPRPTARQGIIHQCGSRQQLTYCPASRGGGGGRKKKMEKGTSTGRGREREIHGDTSRVRKQAIGNIRERPLSTAVRRKERERGARVGQTSAGQRKKERKREREKGRKRAERI